MMILVWPIRLAVLAAAITLAIVGFADPRVLVVLDRDQTAVEEAQMIENGRLLADGHGYIPRWDAMLTTPAPARRVRAVVIEP